MVFGVKTEVSKKAFRQEFGLSPNKAFPKELKKLKSLGLLAEEGDFIRPTLKGSLFSDEMSKEFFS